MFRDSIGQFSKECL